MTNKVRILLVDDEERILRSLGLLLRMQYEVLTTTSGSEALRLLRDNDVHVLISDQRMPEMNGTEVLREARQISPRTVRILLTGYADADATIASVNEGEVFRYISKPWGPKELRDTVALAVDVAKQLTETLRAIAPSASVSAPVVENANKGLKVLVLDVDEQTVQAVREIVGGTHEVLWATSVNQAVDLLSKHPIAVLIAELRLQGEDASTLIKTLRHERPEVVTLIITCFKDTQKVAELINQAQVYRYLPKPVRKGLLARSLESTFSRYEHLSAIPAVAAPVEPIREPVEQVASTRIAGYLQRLRSRAMLRGSPAPV